MIPLQSTVLRCVSVLLSYAFISMLHLKVPELVRSHV